MTSPPSNRDFSASGSCDFSLNLIGQTSGFEHIPKLDETSADNSNTRLPPKGKRAKGAEPRRIGGYELEELIGQGGMGRVYRAEDSTGRFVALKLLSPDLARSTEALARFKQEGLIAGQLKAIASDGREPTLRQLSKELETINKNSQGVTSRLRFLSASVTVGLMSPLMFLAVFILFLPSILQTVSLFKEVRYIKSLAAFSKEPERYQNAWALASPEAKEIWTLDKNQLRIQKTLEIQSSRLESAWDQSGNIERFVIKSIPTLGKTFSEPPIYGGDVEADFGTEVIDAKLMENIIASVAPNAMKESEVVGFPDGPLVGIGILICVLWTTATLGGIVQYFTGTCICNWDGRSLGLLQSFWRATALYLPIFGLAMAIVYCNALGLDYVWYGTQLKRIFLIVPIAVLATTVLWSRKTPLDVLSNTVMIPR